jgi:chromosome partitioning protein
VRTRVNRQLKLAGFVPTIYAAQNSQDVRALAAINEQLSPEGKIFPTVPRATAFADASENRVPLAVYNAKHPAVKVLDAIALSLEEME